MKKYIFLAMGGICLLIIGFGVGVLINGHVDSFDTDQSVSQVVSGDASSWKTVEKNDFSLMFPVGWEEGNAPMGVSALYVNTQDEPNDPEAQRINFQSYLSVILDTFNGMPLADYMELLKTNFTSSVSDMTAIDEDYMTIGGRDSMYHVAAFEQRNIRFVALFFVISGENNESWVLTFNTTEDTWTEYKDTFFAIANTFHVEVREEGTTP